MGFFSFLCAKTGLPIMAGSAASPEDARLCKAVAVFANGDRLTGTYDGYGRLDNLNIVNEITADKARVVLKAFHDNESFTDLSRNKDDPAQGYFHDWSFVHMGFELHASARMFGDMGSTVLSPDQWRLRNKERVLIAQELHEYLSAGFGASIHTAVTVADQLDRELSQSREDSSRWKAMWDEQIGNSLVQAPAKSPSRLLPPAVSTLLAKSLYELVNTVARQEAMRAWRTNSAARMPDAERLLIDPMDPAAWLERPEPAAKQRERQ